MTRRRTHLAAAAALVASLAAPTAHAQDVQLRAIDRAAVRIISIRGAAATALDGRNTHARRVWADPSVRHGSGVAVSDHLIVTAAHVVTGAEHWAVMTAESDVAMAARPRFIHPELDLAVLEVGERLRHSIDVPEPHSLTLSERLSASGYPLDVRETSPAAVRGELARVSRTGTLHLAMAVNPGNSGGPVIDEHGHLVGIVSARGRPEAGVEGLAIAVPATAVRAMLSDLPPSQDALTSSDREVAAAIVLLLSLDDRPIDEAVPPATATLDLALSRTEPDAEADALVASLGWNILLASLEEANQTTVTGRRDLAELKRRVIQLARRAIQTGPHVRRTFPILRAISFGQTTIGSSTAPGSTVR